MLVPGFFTEQVNGSALSGNAVTIQAGRDVTVQASQIVADQNVSVKAEGDITVTTAVTTSDSDQQSSSRKSGFLSADAGFTLGKQSQSQSGTDASIEHIGSQIGSLNGNVELDAGGNARLIGSDVLAAGDITVAGNNVEIISVENKNAQAQDQRTRQSGVSVGVSVSGLDAVRTLRDAVNGARETGDNRTQSLQTLVAARAGYDVTQAAPQMNDAAGKLATGDLAGAAQTAGVQVNVNAGLSKTQSHTEAAESSVRGSSLNAGGNLTVIARGKTDAQGNVLSGGDLTSIGSTLSGANVTLDAANDLVLKAAQETRQRASDSSGSSQSLGVSAGVTSQGIGLSANAAANQHSGDGTSTSTTHIETVVNASGTLSLRSGRDTTLSGAQASGHTVVADVGRNLRIESLQDTATQTEKSQSAGFSASVPIYGAGSSSVSANAQQGQGTSTYQSVNEQSGLFAGDGGFQINVKGNTHLKGGVITSTDTAAQQNRNQLATATLTFENIENQASYSASVTGQALNLSSAPQGVPTGLTPALTQRESGAQHSTTFSGLTLNADGSGVTITDTAAQTALTGKAPSETHTALANQSLGLTTTNADSRSGALNHNPDVSDVLATQRERQAAAGQAVQAAARTVGDIAQSQTRDYENAAAAKESAQQLLANPDTSPADRDAAQQILTAAEQTMAQEQATYDTWKEGGIGKTALQAGASALVAGLGGGNATQAALGTAASQLAAPLTRQAGELVANVVSDQLGVTDPSTKTTLQNIVGDLTTNVASGTIGAAVGGNSGAFGASNMDRFNRQLHDTEKQRIAELAQGDKEREARLQAAACALVECSAEFPTDSDAFRFFKAIEDVGNGEDLANERMLLRQQVFEGEPQFIYSDWDEITDYSIRINDTYQVINRTVGGAQLAGGVLGAIAGATVTAAGTATCGTGVGCFAAAGGVVMTGYSLDQAYAGASTIVEGEPQATLGGQLLAQMLGTSAETAELLYGLAGLAPAAIEALVLNRAIDAASAANQTAKLTSYADETVVSARDSSRQVATENSVQTTGSRSIVSSALDDAGTTSLGKAVPDGFENIYGKAPAAKIEIDALADEIASTYGGQVAKAPIKSEERAIQKIMNDYGGDASRLKDLARNTIVVSPEKIDAVIAELVKRGANVKITNGATDPLGYSGVNSTIDTQAGIFGEVQVNTPAMIYAKESELVARGLLGDELYNSIAAASGIPGGQGHKLYEQWRVLSETDPRKSTIAAQSKAYYESVRRSIYGN